MKIAERKNEPTQSLPVLNPTGLTDSSQHATDNFVKSVASTGVFIGRQSRHLYSGSRKSIQSLSKETSEWLEQLRIKTMRLNDWICSFGVTSGMEESERRRLSLLNQINILHFITCLIIPVMALLKSHSISSISFVLSLAPVFVSAGVLACNAFKKYNAALLTYFILYPFFTCLIYLDGMNLGMELYFIMYGILAVFFLKEISHMLFSVGFSMISYFMLAVVIKRYSFQLETASPGFYFFNQLVAIIFIFYGLYLIMKENAGYQSYILQKNEELKVVNLQIEQQNEIISQKAHQLEQQTIQLTALNTFKTKLFSIISHDLRAPVYALRDLFNNAAQQHVSSDEIKELIPDVASDLSYTADLMENLLQWAKSQMEASDIRPQAIELSAMVNDILQLLRLQAQAKNIRLQSKITEPVFVYADKDMLNLVIRNLLSNAIKFTSSGGLVHVEAHYADSFVEICVKDTGKGMNNETLRKLNENNFFTTKGTANEAGTGLGLMLCKEFLAKNGGRMFIESKEGEGSAFSFTLPISE